MSRADLIVISGPPLHGKTTIANTLAEKMELYMIDPDAIRHLLFPRKDGLRELSEELAIMEYCYNQAVDAASMNISFGDRVIIAATFSKDEFKAPLQRLWQNIDDQSRIAIFKLEVGEESRDEVIAERIAARKAAGNPAVIDTLDKYHWSLTLPTPWWKESNVIAIDATNSVDRVCSEIQQLSE